MVSKSALPLLSAMLGIVGPRPKDAPGEPLFRAGDKIVAVGDSITEAGGYLRDADAVLAREYPKLKLPAIVGKGIGGQKAEDMMARWDKDVIQQRAKIVTLSVGINDVWHRMNDASSPAVLAAYQANVGKMVDIAQAGGIAVILLAPTIIQETVDSEGNKRLAAYVDAGRKIAAEKKCGFVNLHQMFLDALKKKPAEANGTWLTTDGVHMAAGGDAIMAIGMLRALGVPDEKIAAANIQ